MFFASIAVQSLVLCQPPPLLAAMSASKKKARPACAEAEDTAMAPEENVADAEDSLATKKPIAGSLEDVPEKGGLDSKIQTFKELLETQGLTNDKESITKLLTKHFWRREISSLGPA